MHRYCETCYALREGERCPVCGGRLRAPEKGDFCRLTEQPALWRAVLEDALAQNAIPCVVRPVEELHRALKLGEGLLHDRFLVPYERLDEADALVQALFGGEAEPPGEGFAIRPAAEEDLPAVCALLTLLEGEVPPQEAFARVYRRNLEDPAVTYLVADGGEGAIGFVSLHRQELLHHAGAVGEIQELIVGPALRGRGLGRRLFDAACAAAAEAGCVQLEVCCNRSRTQAHDFYRRQGMAESHLKFCLPLKEA